MTVTEVARKIVELFPRNFEERDPFKVLVTTVLSHRTKDENTERASQRLFEVYGSVEELAKAKPEDLYELIRASGMYKQKAERIVRIAREIMEKYGGKVPNTLDELLKLPGVGRKTANIVLWVSFGKPALAVDTHVHRISNRLGWVKTKRPEETEEELKKLLPPELWGPLNGSMVEFGRKVCKPLRPRCAECPLREMCAYPKKGDIGVS